MGGRKCPQIRLIYWTLCTRCSSTSCAAEETPVDVDMKRSTPIRPALIQEAQEWEHALNSGDPAARKEFAAWIRRSPEHLQAYLQHVSIDTELTHLDAGGQLDLARLLAQSSSNVVPITSAKPQEYEPRASSRQPSRPYWPAAAAVGAIALLALGLWLRHSLSSRAWTDYVTSTGEQRRIALPDGSSIDLNTQSHLRVRFSAASRDVELVSGEAVFKVQHNASNPFRVHTRNSVVQDMGTEFAVYLHPDLLTTVSVLNG